MLSKLQRSPYKSRGRLPPKDQDEVLLRFFSILPPAKSRQTGSLPNADRLRAHRARIFQRLALGCIEPRRPAAIDRSREAFGRQRRYFVAFGRFAKVSCGLWADMETAAG